MSNCVAVTVTGMNGDTENGDKETKGEGFDSALVLGAAALAALFFGLAKKGRK